MGEQRTLQHTAGKAHTRNSPARTVKRKLESLKTSPDSACALCLDDDGMAALLANVPRGAHADRCYGYVVVCTRCMHGTSRHSLRAARRNKYTRKVVEGKRSHRRTGAASGCTALAVIGRACEWRGRMRRDGRCAVGCAPPPSPHPPPPSRTGHTASKCEGGTGAGAHGARGGE